MRNDQDADCERRLDAVRRQIERLKDIRLSRPLTMTEQRQYDELGNAERDLLRHPSAEAAPPASPDFVALATHDPAFVREMLASFVESSQDAIEGAVLAGDPRRLAEAAHSIRGSAGAIGAPLVAELAGRLEGAAKL